MLHRKAATVKLLASRLAIPLARRARLRKALPFFRIAILPCRALASLSGEDLSRPLVFRGAVASE